MVQSEQAPPAVILFMDPPEHGRMRGLVSKAFTPRAVSNQRQAVTDVVRKYLHAADPNRFDAIRDFADPFPVEVITGMAGVPAEFRQQVRVWSDEALRSRSSTTEAEQATGLTAMLELFGYYMKLVEERRARIGDDIISDLVSARLERSSGDATSLDDLEIASFAALLAGAGIDRSLHAGQCARHLLGPSRPVAALGRRPEQNRCCRRGGAEVRRSGPL